MTPRNRIRTSLPAARAVAVCIGVVACTPGNSSQPIASAQTLWPADEWPVSTPAAEGIDPVAIEALVADIDAGRYGLIDHFLLIRNGRVVADHHWDQHDTYVQLLAAQDDTVDHQYNYDHPAWHPFYRDTQLHSLQSVTKSVMSVAFGIAVDAGHIPPVETEAWPYFTAYGVEPSEPGRADASLEDFLTMRSGISWATPGQGYGGTHPTTVMELSDAWIDYVVDRPITVEPGTRFDYNDGVSVMLGKIVHEATGQRIDAWAEEHLFGPIGIDEFYWKTTPAGEADSEGGLYLTAHDLARIGYLMLRGGEWNGRQVVSADWIAASTSPVVPDVNPDNGRPDSGYGYQWWVPVHEDGETRIFAANGYGGQFLHVVPEHDLISVFNGWTLHQRPEHSSWMAMQERILPAVTR
jgi:CubicO group peptidase (beta-lactamase class C family)